MEITAALAADLAILSEALDDGAHLADPLRQLARDVSLTVRSYVGLSVLAASSATPLMLTAMEPFARPADIASSLALPAPGAALDGDGWRLTVILYAARPGAFVDLAADLSSLTGRPLTDFAVDDHLWPAGELIADSGLRAASLVNQAIGVLIGRGYTPQTAHRELHLRASAAGRTRAEAAEIILAALEPGR